MNDTFEHKRRWPWIFLIVCFLLALAIFGTHWVWSTGASRRLTRQVAAYRAAGEAIELEDFKSPDVADADNAAIDLRAAADSINDKTEQFKAYDALDPYLPLNEKEIKAIGAVMAENGEAFAKVDLAMTKKGVDWGIPMRSPVISTLLPDLNRQRQLAYLCGQSAILQHTKGDDAAALRQLERISFIGDALGQQPMLISDLVANGVRGIVSQRAIDFAPDLKIGTPPAASREQVTKLIATLLEETDARRGLRDGMIGERAMQLDTARCVAEGKLTLTQLATMTPAPPNAANTALGYAARPIALGDGLIMLRHNTAVRQAAEKSQTWPAFQQIAPPEPPEVINAPWRHLLARMMLPSYGRYVQTHYRVFTERRLAATALAIALYRNDHGGAFPRTLEELVPAYLPAVPADAMAAEAKLQYKPAATQPILYSVGDDGIDGGGDETSKVANPYRQRWQMNDAVVHLTRQPRPPVTNEDALSGVDAESLPPQTTQPTTRPAATEPWSL